MGKKIVVAGAGHGGILAAAKLAEKGYDVTVYEKKIREELGYDWLDAIDLKIFNDVGLPLPDTSEITFNGDMRFYNPAFSAPLTVEANGKGSAKFERKEIYRLLIDFAEDKGVKFVYNTHIVGPIMDGLRVAGLETADGEVYADLVIDAAGVNSPVRRNLPSCCNVDRDYGYGEVFYAYRAYYDKIEGFEPEVNYEVFLVPHGEKGLSWVVTEKDCVDVLVGRMIPLSKAELEEKLREMREFSPQIGTKLLRGGGKMLEIPIRRPLSVMVCDGYAAIGDSAYMTVPMNGSGICASLRAGVMLADTVLADTAEEYSAKTLWNYNKRYILHFGLNFAAVDILKNTLFNLPVDRIDFLFDKQIITQNDLNFGRDKGSDGLAASDVLSRVARGISNLPVLLRTAGGLSKGDAAKKVYRSIPDEYEESAVLKWKKDVLDAHVFMER
ncbi:MAG: NAD(P)/FAD-dependent oxidoreductase [Ruminococcus sp.]|nr:NAD(P)/FAD-dependent oxidoreductase [Ruminococcus sp.]